MLKAPALNQFRGSFGENEVLSMILCIAAAVPFTWGIGILFSLLEEKGLPMKAFAWLDSHTLILYLFHMFYAWIICVITGFSVFYKEPVSFDILAGSVLLTAVSIGLSEDYLQESAKAEPIWEVQSQRRRNLQGR